MFVWTRKPRQNSSLCRNAGQSWEKSIHCRSCQQGLTNKKWRLVSRNFSELRFGSICNCSRSPTAAKHSGENLGRGSKTSSVERIKVPWLFEKRNAASHSISTKKWPRITVRLSGQVFTTEMYLWTSPGYTGRTSSYKGQSERWYNSDLQKSSRQAIHRNYLQYCIGTVYT